MALTFSDLADALKNPAIVALLKLRLGVGSSGGGSDTAAEILAKLVTVDGAGSGLDADKLDGQEGTYYSGLVTTLAAMIGTAGYSNDYGDLDNLPTFGDIITHDASEFEGALGFTPEDVANKDTTTSLGTSDTKYPSQKAVKTYVDDKVKTWSVKRTVVTAAGAGTFTPQSGMVAVEVICVAGGASGGGVAGSSNYDMGAGGGSSGGVSKKFFNAADIGASKGYVVGAGGAAPSAGANDGNNGSDTTFDTTAVVAKGGLKGTFASTAQAGSGGAAPGVGTGEITLDGTPGGAGFYTGSGSISPAIIVTSGKGGDTPEFGGGGRSMSRPTASAGSSNGDAGKNPGAGGSGAVSYLGSSTAAGGAGHDGAIIFLEHILS